MIKHARARPGSANKCKKNGNRGLGSACSELQSHRGFTAHREWLYLNQAGVGVSRQQSPYVNHTSYERPANTGESAIHIGYTPGYVRAPSGT